MSDPLNPKRFKSVSLEPSMMKRIGELNTENARLKAEVERLTWASQGSVKYVDHTMALARQSTEHSKEMERLKAEVERLQSFASRTIIPNEHLQAEVDRLREEQRIKAVPVEAKIMDRLAELKAQVSGLQSKCNLLREAGDDLWYCIRHNDKLGMQEAIEEWKDARHE
jgi:DNA repair ATPase RecN